VLLKNNWINDAAVKFCHKRNIRIGGGTKGRLFVIHIFFRTDFVTINLTAIRSYIIIVLERDLIMKYKTIFGLFTSAFLCFSCFINVSADPKPKLSAWDLVDSGKHLDWSGGTKYKSAFNKVVNTWNKYKPGVIRKDTALTVADVKILDNPTQRSEIVATTNRAGEIIFNTAIMDGRSVKSRRNTCTHELGHALGLADRTKITKCIMYEANSEIVNLKNADRISYDAAYKRY
jgi:hypothetical protein